MTWFQTLADASHTPAFPIDAHNVHVDSLQRAGDFDVFAARFLTMPNMYQPHLWSRSVFMVRSLLRESLRLGRLLEIGGGVGVVGLSMLRHRLADSAFLTDIDPACVDVTRANARTLPLGQEADVRCGDLFAPVGTERFDSIIFNMPLLHLMHDGKSHPALDDGRGALAHRFFPT